MSLSLIAELNQAAELATLRSRVVGAGQTKKARRIRARDAEIKDLKLALKVALDRVAILEGTLELEGVII